MPGPLPHELRTQLAVAIASGESITAWAKQRSVSRRTAYEWSRSKGIRRRVASLRRRALDRAVGKLTKGAMSAADVLLKIATGGEQESVRLQAARAILSDLASLSDFAKVQRKIAEIEKRLDERDAAQAG
jgi:hypothetical protein